jgi:predicted metal-binding transcription factor (methanogenesis marker protein 9)
MNDSTPNRHIRNDATPWPNSFSDNALRRLKEYLANQVCGTSSIDTAKLEGIVDRLEVAEEMAQEAMCHCKYDCDECGKMKTAWQKAKGVSK